MKEKIADRKFLFAVYDGVGGAKYGDKASFCAASETKIFIDNLRKDEYDSEESMLNALCIYLNAKVYEMSLNYEGSMSGTTFAALYFDNDRVWSCNVGDSRCYRLRNGVLEMLSMDHDEDMFSANKVKRKRKARLIQCLGMNPKEGLIEPFITSDERKEGDVFLICSDGLTDMVAEPDIAEILRKDDKTQTVASELIEMALTNGGKDNVTAIVCR